MTRKKYAKNYFLKNMKNEDKIEIIKKSSELGLSNDIEDLDTMYKRLNFVLRKEKKELEARTKKREFKDFRVIDILDFRKLEKLLQKNTNYLVATGLSSGAIVLISKKDTMREIHVG